MRPVATYVFAFCFVILQSSITSATEPAGASTSPGLMESMANLPPAEIERRLPNEPPFNYYGYAGQLWAAGEKDKAVFWMYAGQLRFRFLLMTEPKADPSGDPALFASLRIRRMGLPLKPNSVSSGRTHGMDSRSYETTSPRTAMRFESNASNRGLATSE